MAGATPAASPGLQLPESFMASYSMFSSYPVNLVLKTSFSAALRAYAELLDQFAPRLFSSRQGSVFFREFTGVGPDGGLQEEEVTDDFTLKIRLGDQSSLMPPRGIATKRDPKCRFIFITADSARKPLKITRPMLARILSFHQAMPEYLDFLSGFGSQSEARDLRFSGFREQVLLVQPASSPIRVLGRSGRQFQLSFNLKAVARKSGVGTKITEQDWSIRQTAIHHQFDVEKGTTLWIVTQGHLDLKKRVTEMTNILGRPEDRAFTSADECFKMSLTTHLLHCHWSVENWRWYIEWLEAVVEKETDIAIYGTRNSAGQFIYTPDHVQMVQHREDKINEAVMVMEANTDILTSLRDFYKRLLVNNDFDLRSICTDAVTNFTTQVDNMIYDSRMQIARAKVVVKITTDRKNLILQHLQSQATMKMEELSRVTIKIGTMSQREAIGMRIVTVVTLVYLPATFVSTFFSTDIVKYQQNGGSESGMASNIGRYMGSFSIVALERWLQVTIPLTVITLICGWIAFRREERRADQEFESAQLPLYEDNPKSP